MAPQLTLFLKELKRRKVGRVALLYAVVGIGVIEGAQLLFDAFEISRVVWQLVAFVVVLGFPIALVLAWAYEVRPEERRSGGGSADGANPDRMGETGERRAANSEGPSQRASAETHFRAGDLEFGTPKGRRPSIAALPFDDFSPNPEDAYFANGMHEEVLTQLQKIGGLSVRGRTSVLRYRDEPKSLREIAAELDVDFILEGSARKAGNQVRLTAQLIDAGKDEHLWADNYDRPLTVDNLIGVQSEIAQQVAQTVGVMLSSEERTRIESSTTESLKAYDYYLLGRHHIHQWSLTNIEDALGFLKKSVEVDPGFAKGHAGMAYAHAVLGAFGQPPEDTWPHARASAQRALALDETQAEAHNALALEAMSHRYDWAASEAGFRRALEYNPNSVEALDWLGVSAAAIWGRYEEASTFSRRALEIDPLSLTVRYHLGVLPVWAGELEEARVAFEALEPTGPEAFLRSHGLVYLLMAQGAYDEALEGMKSLAGVTDERLVIYTGLLGYLFGREGETSSARTELARLDDLQARGV
ncbi:MAG: hypothetical protein PVJ76_12780, partial [Gemmatimonadota bacterium]